MNNETNNYSYFMLSILANICQLASFDMNVRETKNDELMKELQKQDKILDEQTNDYLKKIVEQNELIIKQNKEIIKRLDN